MHISTIGFTRKSARHFFGLLKQSGAKRIVDVRLNTTSQLAGLAKQDDLAWFLDGLCGMRYVHLPSLAPTRDLLGAYRTGHIDSLPEVLSAALIFLYRLLFVLYAEDRGLLPFNYPRYDDYGLRKPVREDIARRMPERDTFSATAGHCYNRLIELVRQIDRAMNRSGYRPTMRVCSHRTPRRSWIESGSRTRWWPTSSTT